MSMARAYVSLHTPDSKLVSGKLTKRATTVLYRVMGDIFESNVGKVCVILYALLAIGTYVAAFLCGSANCGLYVILPVMPWAYIFTSDLGFSFPFAMYPVFVLLNASVAYIVGAGIEWTYYWHLDRKTP
jgi:hypothetical protein